MKRGHITDSVTIEGIPHPTEHLRCGVDGFAASQAPGSLAAAPPNPVAVSNFRACLISLISQRRQQPLNPTIINKIRHARKCETQTFHDHHVGYASGCLSASRMHCIRIADALARLRLVRRGATEKRRQGRLGRPERTYDRHKRKTSCRPRWERRRPRWASSSAPSFLRAVNRRVDCTHFRP